MFNLSSASVATSCQSFGVHISRTPCLRNEISRPGSNLANRASSRSGEMISHRTWKALPGRSGWRQEGGGGPQEGLLLLSPVICHSADEREPETVEPGGLRNGKGWLVGNGKVNHGSKTGQISLQTNFEINLPMAISQLREIRGRMGCQ